MDLTAATDLNFEFSLVCAHVGDKEPREEQRNLLYFPRKLVNEAFLAALIIVLAQRLQVLPVSVEGVVRGNLVSVDQYVLQRHFSDHFRRKLRDLFQAAHRERVQQEGQRLELRLALFVKDLTLSSLQLVDQVDMQRRRCQQKASFG